MLLWLSKKEFLDIKQRDEIKKIYAGKNKIDLLVIKYTKLNQTEKILAEKLNNNKRLHNNKINVTV